MKAEARRQGQPPELHPKHFWGGGIRQNPRVWRGFRHVPTNFPGVRVFAWTFHLPPPPARVRRILRHTIQGGKKGREKGDGHECHEDSRKKYGHNELRPGCPKFQPTKPAIYKRFFLVVAAMAI